MAWSSRLSRVSDCWGRGVLHSSWHWTKSIGPMAGRYKKTDHHILLWRHSSHRLYQTTRTGCKASSRSSTRRDLMPACIGKTMIHLTTCRWFQLQASPVKDCQICCPSLSNIVWASVASRRKLSCPTPNSTAQLWKLRWSKDMGPQLTASWSMEKLKKTTKSYYLASEGRS